MEEQLKKAVALLEKFEGNHFLHINLEIQELKTDIKWIKLIGAFIILQSLGILIKLFIH